MTRMIAHSEEEIYARHGCVAKCTKLADVPGVKPYEPIMMACTGPVGGCFATILPSLRINFELVEIYVRRRGNQTVFEPLTGQHFGYEAEWAIIARGREWNAAPRIVGIMLAKDEADVIPDVVASLSGTLERLYYFAGDSETGAAIERCAPSPGWARAIADPGLPHADGLRQFLLEAARADAQVEGDVRPMWVCVVQGDEVYHDDLRHHIVLAQMERATAMGAQVATFVLHESQRTGWDWSQPLATRLNHYIWDFGEHAGFLDYPWIYYVPSEHMRATPHGIYPSKWSLARPVRKHYPFRSPDQARQRIDDRLKQTAERPHGWQPHYGNYQNIFLSGNVAGRNVTRFHGWFGEAERIIDGIW